MAENARIKELKQAIKKVSNKIKAIKSENGNNRLLAGFNPALSQRLKLLEERQKLRTELLALGGDENEYPEETLEEIKAANILEANSIRVAAAAEETRKAEEKETFFEGGNKSQGGRRKTKSKKRSVNRRRSRRHRRK